MKRRFAFLILIIFVLLLMGFFLLRNTPETHLDSWLGYYYFYEGWPSGSDEPHYPIAQSISYNIYIYEDNGSLYAEIYNYGWQKNDHMRARIAGDNRKIDVLFEDYLENHVWGEYQKGELLLSLYIDPVGNLLYTTWNELRCETSYITEQMTGVYFEKIPLPSESPDTAAPQDDTPALLPTSGKGIPTEGPDETVNIAGVFSFSMTVDEVQGIVLENDFDIEIFEGYRHYSTLDNGIHEEFVISGIAFIFDVSGKLYNFWTTDASTARGFTPLDDVARMIELYGDDYRVYESEFYYNCYICEYDFGDYYLNFLAKHDTSVIGAWEVSRYSYEERIAASD